MKNRKILRPAFFGVLILLGLIPALISSTPQVSAQSEPAGITVIRLNATVNPGSADFFKVAITQAVKSGSQALLIELDTPGGLVDSTRDIVKAFLASPIPIIVYVTPPGARAGSAGVMITMAAHVAVMAPGTNIGAAHPVSGTGEKIDENMSKKITNDTVAFVEGIAENRNRNRDWAVKAVRDSVSVTATDALKNGVIDLLAEDIPDLLNKIDGREINLAQGKKVVLKTQGAPLVPYEPGLKHRFIMRLADPNLAYIFMIVGFLGIYAEFSHPGMIFPGVIGVVSFLCFLMSTQILPINLVGVILILLGIGLFIAEIKITSYGALTFGGAVALALGSLFLFDVPGEVMDPNLSFRVSWSLIIPATAGFALIALLITYLVVRVHRKRPQSGEESLLDQTAIVTTDIRVGEGKIKLQGIYWNAFSDVDIPSGQKVKVIKVQGSKITVEPIK